MATLHSSNPSDLTVGSARTLCLTLSLCSLSRRGVQAQPLYVGYCENEFGGF